MKQLSKDEQKILTLIPIGSSNPRSVYDVSRLTGFSRRKIRSIVNDLVVKHHIPIGAKYSKPNGYYIITNEAERGHALVPLISQYGELFKRAQAIANAKL